MCYHLDSCEAKLATNRYPTRAQSRHLPTRRHILPGTCFFSARDHFVVNKQRVPEFGATRSFVSMRCKHLWTTGYNRPLPLFRSDYYVTTTPGDRHEAHTVSVRRIALDWSVEHSRSADVDVSRHVQFPSDPQGPSGRYVLRIFARMSRAHLLSHPMHSLWDATGAGALVCNGRSRRQPRANIEFEQSW